MYPRLRIWSDLECNGGSLVGKVRDRLEGVETLETLDGEDRLKLPVRRQSREWSTLGERKVLRLERSATEIKEYRIRDLEEKVEEGGSELGAVLAEGVIYDLGGSGRLLERIEGDGQAKLRFPILQRTPTEHVQIILGQLSTFVSGAPGYFSVGQIDFTTPVDMIYDWDTALSALQELKKVIRSQVGANTGAELYVSRNGATGYDVNLVSERGASANEVLLKDGRNVSRARHVRSTKKQATVVFPRGAQAGGEERATIRENGWTVASVSGSTVTFQDDLMNEDGQLDGLHVEQAGGNRTQVTASTSPNQVTVSDATGISAGDVLTFRRNGAGDELTRLESPSAVAAYGEIPFTLDRPDIPPVNNLVPNAFLTSWSGGAPTDWATVGGASVSQNTAEENTQKGGSSALVSGNEGEGIETVPIDVFPTNKKPYFSAYASLKVASGSVRIELVDVTTGRVWFPGESGDAAITDEVDVWAPTFGVSPGEDMNASGTQQIKVRLVCAEDGTSFYLDAAALVQKPGKEVQWYDGHGANDLWRAALDHLAVFKNPLSVYETDVIDLNELDPPNYPDEPIVLGGTARLRVPSQGIDTKARIQTIRRRPFSEGELPEIELESEEERLTRMLARTQRRRREPDPGRPDETNRPADVTGAAGAFDDHVVLIWNPAVGAARYEIRTQGAGADPIERWDNGTRWATTGATEFIKTHPDAGSFDFSIRAVSRSGRYSKNPLELTVPGTGRYWVEQATETDTDGTLKVKAIFGGSSRTFTIKFWGRDANGSYNASPDATHTGVPHDSFRSFTRALPEGRGMWIRFQIIDEPTGFTIADEDVHFDHGVVPNPEIRGLDIDPQGDVYLHYGGDSDQASIKFQKKIGLGNEPTKAEVQSGVTVNGRSGRVLIHSGLAPAETIHVGVLGYSQTSAAGIESTEVVRDQATRGGEGAVGLQPNLTVTRVSEGQTADGSHYQDFQVDATASASSTSSDGAIEIRVESWVVGQSGSTEELAWTSTKPQTIRIFRHGSRPKALLAEARDPAFPDAGNASFRDMVRPVQPATSDPDGRVNTQRRPTGGRNPWVTDGPGSRIEDDIIAGILGTVDATPYVGMEGRDRAGTGTLWSPDGKLGSAIAYQSGVSVDGVEPAEAAAEVTSGKSMTVLTDRKAINIDYASAVSVESLEPAESAAEQTAGKPLTDLTDRKAINIDYGGGATVESLEPAEGGAEQTGGKSLTVLVDRKAVNITYADGSDLETLKPADAGAQVNEPALADFRLATVGDDGNNSGEDRYDFLWQSALNVDDAEHTLKADVYKNGSRTHSDQTVTINPDSDTGGTVTLAVSGGDATVDDHHAVLKLVDSGGVVRWSSPTNSVTSQVFA